MLIVFLVKHFNVGKYVLEENFRKTLLKNLLIVMKLNALFFIQSICFCVNFFQNKKLLKFVILCYIQNKLFLCRFQLHCLWMPKYLTLTISTSSTKKGKAYKGKKNIEISYPTYVFSGLKFIERWIVNCKFPLSYLNLSWPNERLHLQKSLDSLYLVVRLLSYL